MAPFPEEVVRLIDGLADPAVLVDRDHHILRFNPAYQVFAGKRLRALQLAAAAELRCCDVARLELCDSACLARRALEINQPARLDEIAAEPPALGARTLIVNAIPLGDGLVVETYRDVTADARIQRRYRTMLANAQQAKIDLERAVKKRTVELREANQELQRTQTVMLHQEKLSALGQLMAGIAHELNNPITFVYGNLDFVDEYLGNLIEFVAQVDALEGLDDSIRQTLDSLKEKIEFDHLQTDAPRLLGSIKTGAERTVAIVRDLKLFSRPQLGELAPADLLAGLESTLNLLTPLLKQRITVVRDFEPLPQVTCNIDHLNQVFMNILTNAAQAIDGEGEIRIRAGRRPGGVRLQFQDNGPGIPMAQLPRIFEPFYTTKEVGKGTGLGLAISAGIVQQHGGSLVAESLPGQGATFTLDLPLEPPTETENSLEDPELGGWWR